MKVIETAGLRFGQGLPKICVPLTGGSLPALLGEIREVRDLPADLFEWRIDRFSGSFSEALAMLDRELLGKPLLCTVRTRQEGGGADLTPEGYEGFLQGLLDWGGFQLLDVELSCGGERVERLTQAARKRGVGTVVSRHDFQKTPPEDEMTETLLEMKKLGADLPKLAVMPQSADDVLRLFSATRRASQAIGPVITMAMGDLGRLTRVGGGLFGSCLTFGAGREASAPGQINTEDLRAILEDVLPPDRRL